MSCSPRPASRPISAPAEKCSPGGYGRARTWDLVDCEADLPVGFSPSLLRVGVKYRALASWEPVPVDGIPQLGLRVVDVVGTL